MTAYALPVEIVAAIEAEVLRVLGDVLGRLAAQHGLPAVPVVPVEAEPLSLRERGSKLTREDVRVIRNEAARGVRRGVLAKQFAISPRYVSQILSGDYRPDPDYVPGLPLEGGTISRRSNYTQAAGDYKIDRATGCWVWLRGCSRGYPIVQHDGRCRRVGRLYFEVANGVVDEDMFVVRTCGNSLCINPRHGQIVATRSAQARAGSSSSTLAETQRARTQRRTDVLRTEAETTIEQARRESAEAAATATALWFATSLDAPLGDGPRAGALADVVADVGAVDPFEVVAAGELRDILGDHDEDSIAALPESERMALIERLYAGGHVDSTAMALA